MTIEEYLNYFVEDKNTGLVAAFVEGFKQPAKLMAVAEKAMPMLANPASMLAEITWAKAFMTRGLIRETLPPRHTGVRPCTARLLNILITSLFRSTQDKFVTFSQAGR